MLHALQPTLALLILAAGSLWIDYCDRRAREQDEREIAPKAHGSSDWNFPERRSMDRP